MMGLRSGRTGRSGTWSKRPGPLRLTIVPFEWLLGQLMVSGERALAL